MAVPASRPPSRACSPCNRHSACLHAAAITCVLLMIHLAATATCSKTDLGRRLQQYDDWLWNPQTQGMSSLRQKGLPIRMMPPSPPAAPPPPSPTPQSQYTWVQPSKPYDMDDGGTVFFSPGNWTAAVRDHWAVWRTVNPVNAFAQAALPGTDGTLLLTESIVGDQAITAVFDSPFDLRTGFSAHFVFRVDFANGTLNSHNSAVGGQGLTLALLPSMPGMNGGFAGDLGYGGLKNTFAVELDFHANDFKNKDGSNDASNTSTADGLKGSSGPDGNHVGINVGGSMVSTQAVHISSPMANSQDKNVWVVYSGDGKRVLQVFFNDVGTDLPPYPILTYNEASLSSVLASETGQVFLGFTASCSPNAMGDISIVLANFTRTPIVPVAPPFPRAAQLPEPAIWSDRTAQFLSLAPPEDPLTDNFLLSTPVIRGSKSGMWMTDGTAKAKGGQSAIATLKQAVNCSIGCSIQFAYYIQNDGTAELDQDLRFGGDGLSLIFVPSADFLAGEKPGPLGYGGLAGTVAVELDTFFTAGVDPMNPTLPDGTVQYIGPDGDHIGVNLNGDTVSEVTWHADQPLNSPGVKTVWVEYIESTTTLQVFYNPFSSEKPSTPVIEYGISLVDYLKTPMLYPAFGASYSTGVSDHYIVNATFRSYDSVSSSGLAPGPVESGGVVFNSFSPSALTLWNTSGLTRIPKKDQGVSIPTPDGSLPLATYSREPLANLVTLTKSIDLAYGFNASFAFAIQQQNYTQEERSRLGQEETDPADVGQGGEGFAFLVLNSPAVNPGEAFGGLGYRGIPNSLAVEFDTYYNMGWDPTGVGSLLDGNHIGIDLNGDMISKETSSLRGDGNKLDNNEVKYVWLEYSTTQQVLRVFFSNFPTQPGEPILMSSNLNLVEVLKSRTAYLGFSSESTTSTYVPKILNLQVALRTAGTIPITVGFHNTTGKASSSKAGKSESAGLAWWALFVIILAVFFLLKLIMLLGFLAYRNANQSKSKDLMAVTASPTVIAGGPRAKQGTISTKDGSDVMAGKQGVSRALPFTVKPFQGLQNRPGQLPRPVNIQPVDSSAMERPSEMRVTGMRPVDTSPFDIEPFEIKPMDDATRLAPPPPRDPAYPNPSSVIHVYSRAHTSPARHPSPNRPRTLASPNQAKTLHLPNQPETMSSLPSQPHTLSSPGIISNLPSEEGLRPRDSSRGKERQPSRGKERQPSRGKERQPSRGKERQPSRERERDSSRGTERDAAGGGIKDPSRGRERDPSRGRERDPARGKDQVRFHGGSLSDMTRGMLDIPKHLRVHTKRQDKTPNTDPRKVTSPPTAGGVASPSEHKPWIINITHKSRAHVQTRPFEANSNDLSSSKESQPSSDGRSIVSRMLDGSRSRREGGGPADFRVEA